jgi:nitrate/TMAO reductase-like tetraheme cytochrome c subunit
MQTRLSPLFFCAFLFVGASASAQESADVAKRAADTSKESQSCIDCHRSGAAPLAVQQWARSRQADTR